MNRALLWLWLGTGGRIGAAHMRRAQAAARPHRHAPDDEIGQAMALAATARELRRDPLDQPGTKCSLCGWMPTWSDRHHRIVLVKVICPAHIAAEEAQP